MQPVLDRLEAVSKILLILATLIGGAWAVVEYFEKKQDARVAETLGYVRRFSSDPLQAAQTRIGMAWYAVRDHVRTLGNTPVSSGEEFARRKRQLVMTVVEGTAVPVAGSGARTGLVADLDLLVGFFSELQVCVRTGLCDRQTAEDYFRTYARRLYCVHEPFIEWKAKSYSQGYGGDLRAFTLPAAEACT